MAVKKPFLKLTCTVCKTANYFIKKTKLTAEKKLEIKKFCKKCRKSTPHKESKK
jgi:large subunit ribosomal protein L33